MNGTGRLLFICAALWCGTVHLSAEEPVENGVNRFLAGDFQGAAGTWSRMLEVNPADEKVRMLLGNCLAVLGKENFAGGGYRAGHDSLVQAAGIFPARNDLRMLSLLAELENGYPTGNGATPGELLDVRSELYAVFDVVFAVQGEAPPQAPDKETLPDGAPAQQGDYVIHVAVQGETLGTIAQKYYRNFDKWEKIWKSNPQLKNPHRLFPGTRLVIPLSPQ